MVTIESNFETQEQIQDALKAIGMVEPVVEETPEPRTQSEPAVTPGKTEPVQDAGTQQEVASEIEETEQTEEKQEPEDKTPPKKKVGGGFQKRIDTLTARIGTLEERLEEESGSKRQIESDLAAAQAELDQLRNAPKAEEKPAGPVRPTRPKRPTLAQCENDIEKFDTALEKYDNEDLPAYELLLDKYQEEIAEQKANSAVQAAEARMQQERNEAEARRIWEGFTSRRDTDMDLFPDFYEYEVPESIPDGYDHANNQTLRNYINFKSSHPAHLLYFFRRDYAEGDSAEAKRLAEMDPMDQLFEIRALEDRLVKEHGVGKDGKKPVASEKTTPAPQPKPPASAAPPAPPAQPKPVQRTIPEPPIETVGGRGAVVASGNLQKQLQEAADAGDGERFRRLRAQMRAAQATGSRGGRI